MPAGLPKPMGKRTVPQHRTAEAVEAPSEVLLGAVRIGAHGIEMLNEDGHLPPWAVNIDDLTPIRELGKGASGTVTLFKNKATGDKYAVKKVNVAGKSGAINGAKEIRSAFSTASPNAVRLYNAYVREGHLLLLMEYMDGGNLEELLDRQPKLPEPAAAYVASQILQALALLHTKQQDMVEAGASRKMVHRDIKPANVLLGRNGDVKIADFGVAGSADSIGLASFVGTATYMSPERIKGQRHGTASDIWSVGVLVAQVLMGEYPFSNASSNFMALLKEVTSTQRVMLRPEGAFSTEAQDFVDWTLKQDSAQRSSAAELLQHPWILKHCGPDGDGVAELKEIMTFAAGRQNSTSSFRGSDGGPASTPQTPHTTASPPPPQRPPPSSDPGTSPTP